jgi:hypothetical protein
MDWNKSDYETPPREANLMAKLVLPTDKNILEPFGGRGYLFDAIIKHLIDNQLNIPELYFNEVNQERYHCFFNKYFHNDILRKKIVFSCSNFFLPDRSIKLHSYDLIITNPPFDDAIKGIKYSLPLLNDKPESRLLFLLPISFFSSQGRSKELKELDCHIAEQYIIPWRIDYLKDGVPMSKCQKEIDGVPQFKNGKPVMCSGRQESDAVFCIKKGKNPNSPISFLG